MNAIKTLRSFDGELATFRKDDAAGERQWAVIISNPVQRSPAPGDVLRRIELSIQRLLPRMIEDAIEAARRELIACARIEIQAEIAALKNQDDELAGREST